ncbi:MarR family transcriptional regulator [Microbacterium marinilacus]
MLDSASVPSCGRGKSRTVPPSVLAAEVRRRGATPEKPLGHTRAEMLVLAALARSPLGRDSAREVAALAGVSPTTASAALQRLLALGLVSHNAEKVARGRVRSMDRWRARQRAWDGSLVRAVRRVTLPEREQTDASDAVPRRFHHLFWNAKPVRLSATQDGEYIAGRLLDADDVGAWAWVLEHIGSDDLRRALSRRGVTDRQRALVDNWLAEPGADRHR